MYRVAGIDEAGRGPLAGPVVAAAVVFEKEFLLAEEHGLLKGLTDSKQLSARQRDVFFQILTSCSEVKFGLGSSSAAEIDKLNILVATHIAMRRAVEALTQQPDHLLVDGLPVPGLPCASTAIVGGDGKSLSIAAGSILAKVTRDRLMCQMDRQYPGYGFAEHKGYGSRAHMLALLEKGPSPIHRFTFRPVAESARIHAGKGVSSCVS